MKSVKSGILNVKTQKVETEHGEWGRAETKPGQEKKVM